MTEELIRKLLDAAHEAKFHSYSPYSRFRVGAALLTADDTIITGCNIENASHSSTVCAEKCAISAAIARGYRTFKAIAVTSDLTDGPIVPCGNCQFMAEFGEHWFVYMTRMDKSYEVMTVKQLLPSAFELMSHGHIFNGDCPAGRNPPTMINEPVEAASKQLPIG